METNKEERAMEQSCGEFVSESGEVTGSTQAVEVSLPSWDSISAAIREGKTERVCAAYTVACDKYVGSVLW
jgi:hypothetical protein